MSNFEERNGMEPVAIISMNGRFPGAKNIEKFWQNLYEGVESVKFFSREELLKEGIDEHLINNPRFVAADAVLDDMDKFDASFFDYSAREAEIMDPQHRMFLECAWEAMESAGYNSEFYDGRVGVYAGSALSGYMIRNLYTNPGLVENIGTFKIMIANSQDFLATRVSYKMDFMGPSINVNTLCSSSLVAVDMACQSLLSYNCDLAIAGGVSFQVSRNEAFFYQEGGIGSADGHCKAYDIGANGTTSGSGLSLVVLKRLEDALEDGDYIHGVIIGSAVNNDGASKNSFTAPNVEGQSECIAEAIAMADINPETISYIEGHGTGTNLGDPIEVSGLTKAFSSYTDKKQFCALGSVKTNIGHLVTAGGVASLIKTTLALENKVIPPSLNFGLPNSQIDFLNTPFYVNNMRTKWETEGYPLRAGVNSLGIGGTNAHIIVEEAPEREASAQSDRPVQLVCLSAKTETALEKMTSNLAEYIKENPQLNVADIAFTLHVGRKNFNHRRAILCTDIEELQSQLVNTNLDNALISHKKITQQQVVFMFSGEQDIYQNLGKELYTVEPSFSDTFDQCAELVNEVLNVNIASVLYPETNEITWSEQQLNDENIKRAVTFAFEYSIAQYLLNLEIDPDNMIGNGVGEVVVACVSGVFSLEDAIKLVCAKDENLLEIAKSITFENLDIPFVSSATGKMINDSEALSPAYWSDSQRQGNDFAKGLEEILRNKGQILFEIGAGNSIANEIEKLNIDEDDYTLINTMPESKEDTSSFETMFNAIAQYWIAGGSVNWYNMYDDEQRHRIKLPTYPFERNSYWIEPGDSSNPTGNNINNVLKLSPRPKMSVEYVAPTNDVEQLIADKWQERLGYEEIGIHDNFFELGGHSLLAAAVATELEEVLNVQIPMRQLYDASTIAELAVLIDEFDSSVESDDLDDEDMENGTI